MEGWRREKVSNLCLMIVDCVNRTAPVAEAVTPYRMIRTTNVRGGRIDLSDARYVDKETYIRWTRRADLKDGDVILTREAPIGEVGIINGHGSVFLGQRLMQYRADPGRIDPQFLYYSFRSPDLQHQFRTHEGSGSVVSHIRVADCHEFQVSYPPLPEQRAIAAVLGALDDKIELNRRMNETLERQARAIFRDWFVDFGPTRAKQEARSAGGTTGTAKDQARSAGSTTGNANNTARSAGGTTGTVNTGREPYLAPEIWSLFPDRLDADGKPEGWDSGSLGNILLLQRGFDLPKGSRTAGQFPVMAASGPNGTHQEFMVRGPGVTTGRSGILGKVFLVHDDFWPLNTSLWVKEYKLSSPAHAYFLLQTLDLAGFNAGSAVPTLNRNHVHNIPQTLPSIGVIEAFSEMVVPLFHQQQANVVESNMLAETRDLLLPKLMSGEIRVRDAEKIAENAA